MIPLYEAEAARMRMREREDIAIIGSAAPRQPMPIEVLFAELNKRLHQNYRPFGCIPPIADQRGKGASDA